MSQPPPPHHDTALPQVSVLLPVHNGADYIVSAMRSMMQQTLRQIEIIVIDDGSTDETPQILAGLAAEDPRIRIAPLRPGRRLPGALNYGLDLVRAPLVARMDADDLSHPDRLAVQKRYLDAHPDVVMLGTSFRRIDSDGVFLRNAITPRDAFMCRWATRFRPVLQHPSIMFRHPLPDGTPIRYEPAFDLAEDLELFTRIVQLGGLVEIPEILLDYRHHPQSTSTVKKTQQAQLAKEICSTFIAKELPAPVAEGLAPALAAFFDRSPESPAAILAGLRAMLRHDIARAPGRTGWLRRQTAALAFEMLNRAGRGKFAKIADFLWHGPDFLPHLPQVTRRRRGVFAVSDRPDVWAEDAVAEAGLLAPDRT